MHVPAAQANCFDQSQAINKLAYTLWLPEKSEKSENCADTCDKILDTVRVTKCCTFSTSQVDYSVVAANAQRPKILKPDNFLAIYIGESLFCLRQREKISKIIFV